MDAGTDGFFMDSYRDELDKLRYKRFSRRNLSVPSSKFLISRSVNGISFRSRIITISFCTSNNLIYYSSLLSSGLEASPMLARIVICLLPVQLWVRAFRTMSMSVMDGGGTIVRLYFFFGVWLLQYSGSQFLQSFGHIYCTILPSQRAHVRTYRGFIA